MDSETSSVASFRMDRTPATPDEDLEEVRSRLVQYLQSRQENFVWTSSISIKCIQYASD